MLRAAGIVLDVFVRWRPLSKVPRASIACVRLACFSAFLSLTPAFAADDLKSETSDSNTNVASESTTATQKAIGPTTPIGHSLQTPEAKRRIETLISEQSSPSKTSLGESSEVNPSLPTLVNGRYGFAQPNVLNGIPKAFVNLGDKQPSYAIVVEKLHHRLTVFRATEDRRYEAVKTYRAITGKDPNDKKSTGDLRTPEGIYFITGYLDGKELPAKYGRMAFTLDYPNIYDQRVRKSGYGIWIHATDDPKRLLKPYDTQGCVALSNEDISELQQYIVSFETPVVITKEMTTGNYDDVVAPRKPAMEMIESWRKSWEASDFDSYMTYYSKNFRSLSRNKDQWDRYKKQLSKMRNGEISVTISEPKILAFEDQLLVTFLQDYKSKQHSDSGRKFLYLQWEGDRYRIIAEKWYVVKQTETARHPIQATTGQL